LWLPKTDGSRRGGSSSEQKVIQVPTVTALLGKAEQKACQSQNMPGNSKNALQVRLFFRAYINTQYWRMARTCRETPRDTGGSEGLAEIKIDTLQNAAFPVTGLLAAVLQS
jgi:hypothetical protein